MNNDWRDPVLDPPISATPIWIATEAEWGAIDVWAGRYYNIHDGEPEWISTDEEQGSTFLYPEDYTILGWTPRKPLERPEWR